MNHSIRLTWLLLVFTLSMYNQSTAQLLPPGVKKFALKNLIQNTQEPLFYNRFLDEAAISAGIYQLKAGAIDDQTPHVFDEIYYVLEGEAILNAGDSSAHVRPGSIMYVRANVPHQFVSIKSDLTVLVLFSKAKPSSKDHSYRFYKQSTIAEGFAKDEITWSAFHKCGSMTLGIYSLPKVTGGDSTLTHKADEINVVLKGNATFSIDGKTTTVEKGDIIFVPKGNGHYFHDLKNDFEVMIMFESKSVQK
jgi:mannose-6-phosphate isomerase-like protein (cupin superfamily)